jgi:transposase
LNSELAHLNLSAMVRALRDNTGQHGESFMHERTISESVLDGLLQRISDVKNIGLNLDGEDVDLILNIVNSYALMCEKLKGHDVTVNSLRKELGIKPRRESLKVLSESLKDSQGFASDSDFSLNDQAENPDNQKPLSRKSGNDSGTDSSRPKHGDPDKKSSERNGKRSAEDFERATKLVHELTQCSSGDSCSHCGKGKFYKYQPAQFIRISGQAPLQATHHVQERIRCNACGTYETAELPEEVLADGESGQMYGFSARSVMAIHKFLVGHPYHRQETLSEILGCPVAASTVFEQCEKLANAVKPIHDELQNRAATAFHYHIDDTRNRIIDADPVEKEKRNGKGKTLRTAVFTSLVVATLADEKNVILFKTNIGHAGEMIDSILEKRPEGMAVPLLMSDALSWNKPTVMVVIHSLCMAHSRRQFCDLFGQYPQLCASIIQKMDQLFDFDRDAKEQQLDPEKRLQWHKDNSLPIMEELKQSFIASMETGQIERNSNMGEAMGYFLKHYQGLLQFCITKGARLHNNLAECILRMVVLGRKNAFFYKTTAGAAIADVIMSVGATAQLNGVNVFDYFNVLQRHHEMVKQNPDAWLPWTYQTTLAASDS